jgi:hypothetical protein
MPPQTQIPLSPKEEFNRDYWFNSLQMITVINPKPIDWPFMVEMRHFIIKAGAQERFPGVIANVYLDQMTKILAQDDENLGYMADPVMKKVYYDKLIVNVESLINEIDKSIPEYMKNVSPTTLGQAAEKAPWDNSQGERASEIVTAPIAPPATPEPPKAPDTAPVKEETKEFELEGSKYKMIIAKDGRRMYYMNGGLTSEATYAKAASML